MLFFVAGASCSWQNQELNIALLEKEIFEESNRCRGDYAIPSLDYSSSLSELARSYSKDMARRAFFSHIDPDGRNIRERLWAAGISFRSAGENLARVSGGYFTSNQILSAWAQSLSHRQALLAREYKSSGVGIISTQGVYYITQIFIEPSFRKKEHQ